MLFRAVIIAAILVTGRVLIGWAAVPEKVTTGGRLYELPFAVGQWAGRTAAAFDDEIVRALGVDEYVHRVYRDREGSPVWLYVGFHASQSEGDSIHSPLNCLPGAGWEPVERTRTRLQVAGDRGRKTPVEVNQLIIEKGAEQQVVIYWYQSHGRVVASEYWSKAFTVLDALRLGRSDASFVRVIVPVSSDPAGAAGLARQFASDMFPTLASVLPL